jgi:glyoxylase-like metal-dependent hydrolase (beta-lactamase superfamily II)
MGYEIKEYIHHKLNPIQLRGV